VKLGKREIDALTCPPGRQDVMVTDDELKGFAVRVTSSGTKTFLFQYRFASRVRRMKLGTYGEITPAQARKQAEAARGTVAAGGDPLGEREARQAAAVQAEEARKQVAAARAFKVGALVDQWHDLALRDRKSSYRKEAVRCLKSSLQPLMERPAGDLESDELQKALDKIARPHPTSARRVRAYGRAMYGWAVRRRLVGQNPFDHVTVEGREVSRDRVLSDDELGQAWRAASALPYPFGPYLSLLILTLQRRSEVAGMRWPELSPDLTEWTIPASRAKNGKAHIVHLPPITRDILRGLPRVSDPRTGAPSPLVFTTTGSTPISGFQSASRQLAAKIVTERKPAAAEGEEALGWRLHDLRRTGVTVLARLGIPPHVADRLLNHIQGSIKGVAAVYQRHDFLEERRLASEQWAGHVLTAGATPAPQVVIDLQVRRGKQS